MTAATQNNIGSGRIRIPGSREEPKETIPTVTEAIDLRERPVTEEAYAYLIQQRPGAHAFINFFPKMMQAEVAVALGRQIEANEIPFFVGFDGKESVVCSARKKTLSVEIDKEIADIKAWIASELETIDSLDSSLYSNELKEEEKERASEDANDRIKELESQKENNPKIFFMPVFWVSPGPNKRLLEELRLNGGDVARAFLAGDRANALLRTGCFYEFNGEVKAYSGSPWFYDHTKGLRIATSPLGRATVRHPAAGNNEKDIKFYFGGANVYLKQIWGMSLKEMERLKKTSKQKTAGNGGRKEEKKDVLFLTDKAIDEDFEIIRMKDAQPQAGKGCRK